MGKPRSVFSNRSIIDGVRQTKKNDAYTRNSNVTNSASPTVTKANSTRYDSSRGTQVPLGDSIHDIGSATKRYNRIYASRFGLDTTNDIAFSASAGIIFNVGTTSNHRFEFQHDGTQILLIHDTQIDVRKTMISGGIGVDLGASGSEFDELWINTFKEGAGGTFTFNDGTDIVTINGNTGLRIYHDAGTLTGSLIGIDAATDVFQIDVANNVNFIIANNGTTFFEYISSTSAMRFVGSAGMRLDTDYLDINDVTSNPATPASGYGRIFVFDDGSGNQTLRVKFDNGTVKDIANDT